jgi:hypothetical protein
MTNLVVLGANEWWANRYIKAASANDIQNASYIDVRDLAILTGKGTSFGVHQQTLAAADIFIFLAEKYEYIYNYVSLAFPNKLTLNGKNIKEYPEFSDKFIQSLLVSRVGEYMPDTLFSLDQTNPTVESLGWPQIIKLKKSSQGAGVYKAAKARDRLEIISEFAPQSTLSQRFVSAHPVIDFRTITLGEEIVGTTERTISSGFKTNGAKGQKKIEQTPAVLEVIQSISQQLMLDLAAYDYIIRDGKPVIYEINRYPYLHKFESALNIDLSDKIIKFLISKQN